MQQWTLLYDIELVPGDPAPPWEGGIRHAKNGSSSRENGATTSVLVGADGRTIFVDASPQPQGIRSSNIRGFDFRIGDEVVAVIDVSAIGAPHAFLAREATALRPTLVAAMAAIYLLAGLKP
jgi:hypothetical protein